jgi:uncharacterized membrane protein
MSTGDAADLLRHPDPLPRGARVPSALPTDRAAHARLRRRAWLVTSVALVVVGWWVLNIVLALRSDDQQVRASAAWSFLWAGVWAVVGGWASVRAWRRSHAARPFTQQLGDLGRARPSGVAQGVPELDAEAGRHVGLTGQVPPPGRW